MRIATWNINSIRPRIGLIERLNAEQSPDVICLQETKVEDDLFPREAVAAAGYPHQAIFGMRAYHGVAIISKVPLKNEQQHHWCGKTDTRHVSAMLPGGIDVHNLYIPAGGDVADRTENEKFGHKLDFYSEQADWWKKQKPGAKRILVGDLNVAPLETDVWSHKQLLKVVSHTPIEIDHYARMFDAHDWVDAVRHFVPPEEVLFSWWSYRAKDWRKSNRGRRLDHIWATKKLIPKLEKVQVIDVTRDWEKTSDHVPIILDIKD